MHDSDQSIGSSAEFRAALEAIKAVAATDCVVLIQGETGTGKEGIALFGAPKGLSGGRNGPAARLGLKRATLILRMKKLGVSTRWTPPPNPIV
jgi:transcriptional regulator with GAF, ATPase, and Fis domain